MRYFCITLFLLFLGCQTQLPLIENIETTVTEVVTQKDKHPYFNDKGTLHWYNDDSFDKALHRGNKIVLEIGKAPSHCIVNLDQSVLKFSFIPFAFDKLKCTETFSGICIDDAVKHN